MKYNSLDGRWRLVKKKQLMARSAGTIPVTSENKSLKLRFDRVGVYVKKKNQPAS